MPLILTSFFCTSSGRLVIAPSIRRTAVSYDPSLLAAIRDTPDVHASFPCRSCRCKQEAGECSEAKSPPPSGESASDSDSQKSADLDDPRELAPAPSSVSIHGAPVTPYERGSVPPPASALVAPGPAFRLRRLDPTLV